MANYSNKTFTASTYTRKLGVQDSWTYNQANYTYNEPTVSFNYVSNPVTYTNKASVGNETELLIDGTYNLLIDDTFKLLAEKGVKYSNKARAASVYTNKQQTNSGFSAQELLIDDTYELLIDGTYSLEIQTLTPSQVYTNKIINN